jgi:hypothetical protein
VLRPCFINARTTTRHVDEFIETVVRFGDEISAEMLVQAHSEAP